MVAGLVIIGKMKLAKLFNKLKKVDSKFNRMKFEERNEWIDLIKEKVDIFKSLI